MTEEPTVPIASMLKRGEIKILIIEDDKFLRELLMGKFVKEGYRLISAPDGQEGLKIAREETPHLIILDLLLPGLGGFEVLEALRKDSQLSRAPVVVLSNLSSDEDIEKAKALGAREFMVKAHHTPEEIVHTVKKILDDSYLQK